MTNTNMTSANTSANANASTSASTVAVSTADMLASGLEPTGLVTPESPWAIRHSVRRKGRAALEVYERGELLDILVETRLGLGAGLVRGARRESRHGRWASIAWGRLPRDGVPPVVAFVGRLGRRRKPVRVTPVAGAFWFACAEGSFHNVLVQPSGGPAERLRTQRAA